MNRDNALDVLKGIGIILMVIGHAHSPFTKSIYLFHMAIFFILAGHAYNDRYSESVATCYVFFKKRVLSLYKPFVLWNMVYLLLTNVFIQMHIYTSDVEFLKLQDGAKWGLIQELGIYDLTIRTIQILTFGPGQQLAGVSWFLVVLFTVSIAYNIVDLLLKAKTNKSMLLQFLLSVVLLSVGYMLSILNVQLPRLLSTSISIYSLFFVGKALQRHSTFIFTQNIAVIVFIFFLSGSLLAIISPFGSISLDQNEYTNPAFLLVTSVSGWFLCLSASILIDKSKLSFLLGYVGKNTIPIMFLHFLSFKFVNYIYAVCYSKPLYIIASFPTAYKDWWFYYALTGLLIPLGLNFIYEKATNAVKIRSNFGL